MEDKFLSQHFEGLFPRDNPRNTRFAINFFTSIGLGGLTEGIVLRHLGALYTSLSIMLRKKMNG